MTIYVFVGPTVSPADAQQVLGARYLPPAAQGDLHKVALERPYAIGIIDGYFQRVPSVWHKEILWAMAQGIRVYGSASMGALRAAELAPFGMIGVGWVYEAFRSGALEDDDEVAIAHASEEHAYRAASEAMVNIRRSLQRAADESVISVQIAEALIGLGKALRYPERSYARILADAAATGADGEELERLRAWLPAGAINQKRTDALAMLAMMKAHAEERRPPLEVRYAFEHTALWEAARHASVRVECKDAARALGDRSAHDCAVLDELKLTGSFAAARRAASARALALEVARHVDRKLEGQLLHEAISEFRHERGLSRDEDFERWLEAQEIGDLDFFQEEGLVRLVNRLYQREALRLLPDQLRSTGDYGRLLERARDKEQLLLSRGQTEPPASALGDGELIAWYFAQRLRRPVPADLAAYLQEMEIASVAEFVRALSLEHDYLQALAKGVCSTQ